MMGVQAGAEMDEGHGPVDDAAVVVVVGRRTATGTAAGTTGTPCTRAAASAASSRVMPSPWVVLLSEATMGEDPRPAPVTAGGWSGADMFGRRES